MTGLANDLNIQQAGYVVHNGAGVFTGNTLQATNGLTAINGSGVAGNTTISLPVSTQGQLFSGNGANTPIFSKTVTGIGNWTFTNQTLGAGSTVISCRNVDTSSSSSFADIQSVVVAGSIADAFFLVGQEATVLYAIGTDISDSNALKISEGAVFPTPTTGVNLWRMSSGGTLTMPLQPCFNYYASTQTSVTGDGTVFTIAFANKLTDQASNFATPTFTANQTGNYLFTVQVTIDNLSASYTDCTISLVTTARSYQISSISPGKVFETNSGLSSYLATGTIIVPMAATNTASVTVAVTGSTKSINVLGGGSPVTSSFSGALIC